jgi:uncharacterized protein
MNNLQRLRAERQYLLLTLNRSDEIDPEKAIRRFEYDHPVYTAAGVAAQRRHGEISGVRRTHYRGAYWGWGFHGDGVLSALHACEQITPGPGTSDIVSRVEAPTGAQSLETIDGEMAA